MPRNSKDNTPQKDRPLEEFFNSLENEPRRSADFTLAEVTKIIREDRDAAH